MCADTDLGLQHGDHLCALYFGPAERDLIVHDFLEAGLRAGDRCLCLVEESDSADGAAAFGDRVEVRHTSDVYLCDGGFSPEQMIDYLEATMRAATADGHSVRASGDMTWALSGPPGADRLIDYESDLNRFAPRYPQILLCMYDLDRFGGDILVGLIKTHPKLLLGGLVLDNPHYLSPEEYRATLRRPAP
jgi:hypothetical protein